MARIKYFNPNTQQWEYADKAGISHSIYYTPTINQIDDTTAEITYTPSDPNMPTIPSSQITLPQGPEGIGVASLVYDGYPNPREVFIDYFAENMIPGATYRVSIDVLGSLEKLAGGIGSSISYTLHPLDENREWVGNLVGGPSIIPNTLSWQTLIWNVTLPAGATNPKFRIGFYNARGTVYVDNFSIIQLTSPGVENFTPVAVNLINPSFEDEDIVLENPSSGWSYNDYNINYVMLSNEASSEGSRSVKMQYGLLSEWKVVYTDGEEHIVLAPPIQEVGGINIPKSLTYNHNEPLTAREVALDYVTANMIPNATYEISVDVMGGLKSLTDNSPGVIGYTLHPLNANGEWAANLMGGPTVIPDWSSWKKLTWKVKLPAGTTNPKIRISIYNVKGEVYVDNLTITQVTDASGASITPVKLNLVNPSFEEGLTTNANTGWVVASWTSEFISLTDKASSVGSKCAKLQYGMPWKLVYTNGYELPIEVPEFMDTSSYMPIYGGTFKNTVYAHYDVTASAQLRNTALTSYNSYPTNNGQINWQYE